jgi:hypothetical protein
MCYCGSINCNHSTKMNADRWPDELPIGLLASRMVSTRCGHRGADVRPTMGVLVSESLEPLSNLTGCRSAREFGDPLVSRVRAVSGLDHLIQGSPPTFGPMHDQARRERHAGPHPRPRVPRPADLLRFLRQRYRRPASNSAGSIVLVSLPGYVRARFSSESGPLSVGSAFYRLTEGKSVRADQ